MSGGYCEVFEEIVTRPTEEQWLQGGSNRQMQEGLMGVTAEL
jgi:hypothetical protein